MDYFRRSQNVRLEILANDRILTQAKEAFHGKIEEFGWGSTVNLYRVGVLSSGLYVAMRTFRRDGNFEKDKLDAQKKTLEQYCLNAEELDAEGKNVPTFCVGVVYGRRAAIFTEDVTDDGREEFEHNPDSAFAFVGEGTNRRKVYIDIDHCFKFRPGSEAKYFLNNHVIKLTRK